MEQHAIPQQISSYEFKLVGEMTLKQFLKAAVGIILALLINATKLIIIVKWPLMLVLGGGGLLLAFVPFEDRPLENWIMSFIKSIYRPTIYTYKKNGNKNWLDLDATKVITSTKTVIKKTEEKEDEGIIGSKKHRSFSDFFQTTSLKDRLHGNKEKEVETTMELEKVATDLNKGEIKKTEVVASPTKEDKEVKTANWRDEQANLGLKSEKLEATGKVLFGAIPMPDIPEVANVIVGMATSNEGKIVDGVIVEIQDEHGNPSRVLKTNSLGQFKISTPLANGRYLIIAEKTGYIFDRVNLDLNGQIVEPIKIIAHN